MEKTIGWLSWLAGKMREHSQWVFLVEELQPSWLGTRAKRLAYGTVAALGLALTFALIVGLETTGVASPGGSIGFAAFSGATGGLSILLGVALGCWSESPLKNAVTSGLIAGLSTGLIIGLISRLLGGGLLSVTLTIGLIVGPIAGAIGGLGLRSLNRITLVETLSWKWGQFWKRTIPGSIVGLIAGLIVMPGFRQILGLDFDLRYMLIPGLIGGLIGGLISGLIAGFTDRVKVDKAHPNQGINLSKKNSLAVVLVTLLSVVPIGGFIGWLIGIGKLIKEGPYFGIIAGIVVAPIVGLIAGLNRGGSAVIKHYALRLILWLGGYTPRNFVAFLDHCAKLILLKKVGGGYIFIHRMLLEYFADLPAIERSGESKRT